MPYCSSVTEFEEFFKNLLDLDLGLETKSYYQEKYNTKEKWCMAFKKTLPCLKINTTSRIEGLNAIIKKEINSSAGIVELFYRLINISNHMLNITYSDSGVIHSDHLNALEEHFILKNLKNYLSPYAYAQTALNLSKSFLYELKLYSGVYKIKHPEEPEIQIQKAENMACVCKYYRTMGILCPHLIQVGLRYKVSNMNNCIRERWKADHQSHTFQDTKLSEFIQNFLIQEGKDFYFFCIMI